MGDIFSTAAEQYGVPRRLLLAIGQQESGLNPNVGDSHIAPAVGTERATGMMQIKPSTAKDLGIDPGDPSQAVIGAARYLRQGFDKFGNWDDATRFYHGGPNTKLWGPRTQQYHQDVSGKLGDASTSDNPFRAVPQQSAPEPSQDNPFRLPQNGDTQGNAPDNPRLPVAGDQGGGLGSGGQSGSNGRDGDQNADQGGEQAAGAGGLRLNSALDWLYNKAPTSLYNGTIEGLAAIPETVAHGLGYGANALGYGDAANSLHGWADNLEQGLSRTIEGTGGDQSPGMRTTGKVIGNILGTLPVTSLNVLKGGQAAKAAAAGIEDFMPSAVARYGDMAIQGAAATSLASGGHDIAANAEMGAVAGPALGKALEVVAPPAISALSKANAWVSQLSSMIKGGASKAGIAAAAQKVGINPAEIEGLDAAIAARDAGKQVPQVVLKNIEKAMGSNGARSGIEATSNLPASVSTKVDELTAKGVPTDQALREADILHVGGKPTVAQVTRDPAEQSAMWEGAKQPTPEGRMLSDQIAGNNAALHNHVQSMVENFGGVPAHGEAIQAAAEALAARSAAAKAKVSQAYTVGRLVDGERTVSVDPLRELLATPQFKAPTDAASRELITGTRKLVQQMSGTNGNRFTPEQIEDLRQAANAAYDKMGGSVNDKVGKIKAALDQSLDQLDEAGLAYKQARTLHREWAEKYENPKGIADLIRTDAKGEFLNADNWRKAEGIIPSLGDKQFIQITRQLRNDGDTEALNRLKATIVQKAYERASSNAKDKLGNATVNGKLFSAELNKIGMPKLKALFTSDEIADLATVGRAATHMNEAVPGTVNTSNTASALVKAMTKNADVSKKTKLAARVLGHGVAAVTHPVVGNVAVEGAIKGTQAIAEHQTAKGLAAALRESMNPEIARAAKAAEAQRVVNAMRRRTLSRKISERSAPVAAPLQERRR